MYIITLGAKIRISFHYKCICLNLFFKKLCFLYFGNSKINSNTFYFEHKEDIEGKEHLCNSTPSKKQMKSLQSEQCHEFSPSTDLPVIDKFTYQDFDFFI